MWAVPNFSAGYFGIREFISRIKGVTQAHQETAASALSQIGKKFIANPERSTRKAQVMLIYTMTRYHKPNDEFNAAWDLSGAVADARLLLECLVRCANADDVPTWSPGDEFEKLR